MIRKQRPLREVFHKDIESIIIPDKKARQNAILRLYDATDPDPASFPIYCRRQLSEEDLKPTRSLVTEIGDACKDAQVALEYMGDHDNASWLDDFAEQEWLDPNEYPGKSHWFGFHSGDLWNDGPPYYPYPGQSDRELTDNQLGHRIAWEFGNDLL